MIKLSSNEAEAFGTAISPVRGGNHIRHRVEEIPRFYEVKEVRQERDPEVHEARLRELESRYEQGLDLWEGLPPISSAPCDAVVGLATPEDLANTTTRLKKEEERRCLRAQKKAEKQAAEASESTSQDR